MIANDSINDSICIDNVNNDYTTQEMVIGFYKLTLYSMAKNRTRFPVSTEFYGEKSQQSTML